MFRIVQIDSVGNRKATTILDLIDMAEKCESEWVDAEFVNDYLDTVEIGIPQRKRMFELTKSFYNNFLGEGKGNRLLDLGCGDGILTEEILSIDSTSSATLVDMSAEMLDKARVRFQGRDNIQYIQTTFQELMVSGIDLPKFDFVMSSLAIHHLPLPQKKELFRFIRAHLNEGGYFVNIDCILPPTEALEEWYLKLWDEWLSKRCSDKAQVEGFVKQIYDHHMENEHHRNLDTIWSQLQALEELGFQNVDCIFKDGVLTIYCGKR